MNYTLSLTLFCYFFLTGGCLTAQEFTDFSTSEEEAPAKRIDLSAKKVITSRGEPAVVSVNKYGYTTEDGKRHNFKKVTKYPTGEVVEIHFQRGFISNEGKVVIPPVFNGVVPIPKPEETFFGDFVKPGRSYFEVQERSSSVGIIDDLGNIIVPFEYSWINRDGRAGRFSKVFQLGANGQPLPAQTGKPKVTYKRKGSSIFQCIDQICDTTKAYTSAMTLPYYAGAEATDGNNIRYLFDDDGKLLLSGATRDLRNFDGRYYVRTVVDSAGLYDLKTRKWGVTPNKKYVSTSLIGQGRVIYNEVPGAGEELTLTLADMDGNVLIPGGRFTSFRTTRSDLPVLLLEEGMRKFLYDLDGKMLLDPAEYDDLRKVNDGILYMKNNRIGLVHPRYHVVFPAKIDRLNDLILDPNNINVIIGGEDKMVLFRDGKYSME